MDTTIHNIAKESVNGTYRLTEHLDRESVNRTSRTADHRTNESGTGRPIDDAARKSINGGMGETEHLVHESENGTCGMADHRTNESGMGIHIDAPAWKSINGGAGMTEHSVHESENGTCGTSDHRTNESGSGGLIGVSAQKSKNGAFGSSDRHAQGPTPIDQLELEVHGCTGSGSGRWPVVRNVVVMSIAFMVHFTAYQGAGNLQSSINSAAGLGTASLAAVYGTLTLSNTFLTVVVIRWLGCKWAVALSFITYMPYILAQFRPDFYTLIPAALFVGLGGGPLWCGKCTYLSVVAEAYSKLTAVPVDTVTIRFFGIFFMIFHFSQVWGNLISSLVFSVGVSGDVAEDVGDQCGANFCPGSSSNSNNTNLSRPSDEKIYTVAGIYLGCMALAVCIVALGVDSLKRYNEDTRQGSGTGLSGLQLLSVTLKLLKDPRQMMIIPLVMWMGMEQAFIGADYTASFVTCAWGVRNVGFVMICYGVVNSASAVSMGALVKLTGRVPIVTGAALLNIGLIISLLLWTPNVHYKPIFFIIAGLWGAADGVWLVQINAMCGFLFPGREEAAYSNYSVWQSIGFIIAYAYSSALCTDVKLYILLVLLLVGLVGYYIIEWQLRREATNAKPVKD